MRSLLPYFAFIFVVVFVSRQGDFYTNTAASIHKTFDNLENIKFQRFALRLNQKLQKENIKTGRILGVANIASDLIKSTTKLFIPAG